MSDALKRYRELEARLVRARWIHVGIESTEEDEVLDQMDGAWSMLSTEEQATLNAEGAQSLLRDEHPATRITEDEDVWLFPDLPPRRKEVA